MVGLLLVVCFVGACCFDCVFGCCWIVVICVYACCVALLFGNAASLWFVSLLFTFTGVGCFNSVVHGRGVLFVVCFVG